jgi:hypothetical protein
MATQTVQNFGPKWCSRGVVVVHGQHDTRIETGEDYDVTTLASVFLMEPGDKDKLDGDAIIPSAHCDYDARNHARQREVGAFGALTGDIDSGDHPRAHIESLVRGFCGDAAWLIYSSAHARPGDMRWRVIIPLEKTVSFDEWHDAQNAFFRFMEQSGVEMDQALDRAGQLVFLPNVPEFHSKTGERLRGEEGWPLYFDRATTGCNAPGLDLSKGPIASGIAEIRRKRAEDERERERIRREAEQRRANKPRTEGAPIIEDFNRENSIARLFELYGYEQSPRHPEDWRSPHQTSESYATRIMGDKWVSLSASDVGARLGENFKGGCFGDAYDLFVHFEHSNDHKAAFRTLYAERRVSAPTPAPPPIDSEDPGWTEPPEGAAPETALEPVIEPEDPEPDDVLGFNLLDWSTGNFLGEAPPIEWLCEGTIPQGVPALFAAMGGVGKSFISLDLALEIAATVANGGHKRRVMGGEVVARGSVVVLSAEDGRDSIHRRLERIDPGKRREDADGKVFIVPMPEVGGPMPLVTGDRGEFKRTPQFHALIAQLRAVDDLKLIIIDPLQAFVTADITKDPAAGQYMWSAFAQICAETGATVIACHHMRKEGMSRIDSSDSAREAIRGSTALIDGARASYALWSEGEEAARRICSELDIEFQPKRVVRGAVVKSNDEHDWEVHTYIRADSGLLEDATDSAREITTAGDRLSDTQRDQVFDEIESRWRAENPFGASPQSPERYLPNWLQQEFGVSKKTAKDHFNEWMIGGMLATEMFDRKRKKTGLKVAVWPR